ncbi:MAG: portal protein, partial [bacterium]
FNINRTAPVWFKNLIISGDLFLEMVINEDNPKEGFYRAVSLPPEQIFRIETIKGRLLEFQQAKDAPDIKSAIAGMESPGNVDEKQTNVIRFHPNQMIHIKIGDDRQQFYPYGQSLIEPARGPAHSLRLMEDAMLVYRLCLTGDARVRTDKGWKYIKDINKNDCVYTLCPDGNVVKSYVENQVCNGIKEVYCVRSKHIEIKGTETHPVLVNRNGVIQYVDIKDLNVRVDKLLCIPHESNVEKTIPRIFGETWAKISKKMRNEFKIKKYNKSELLRSCDNPCRAKQFLYQEGKSLPLDVAVKICDTFDLNQNELITINKGEYNSERISIPQIVDENFARLFGFMHGDGNIGKNQLNFTTGEDSAVNEKYRSLLEMYFGKVSFQLDKRSKKGYGKNVVCSSVACKIFKELGYGGNHNTCRVPDWVFNCSKEIRKAFVEGFSDADGCERHTENGTWFSTIELSNKGLVEDIKELWSSIGLCSGQVKERQRKGGHEIVKGRIMPPTKSYSVTISERSLPQFENITSVKYIGKEDVYDITVSNPEHNFIVNGTCVHNTRAPERRVFYIDVGQLPPFKAEAYMERLKDQYRKRKTTNARASGANAVEEKWTPPAQDEDYWVPTRPNSATRIDTLPGAEHLGEIDDAIYFRNKLFTALNFPKNYLNNEDPSTARVSLSYLDSRFARMIERLQGHFEDGILELAERHLKMRGFPEESFQDLKIKMTPPSEHREVSRADVLAARYSNAGTLKSAEMMSDFDIYTQIFKYTKDEAEEMLSRLKLQKLENLKLQVLAQNPTLMGIGIPGEENQEPELGTEPGGPSEMPPLDGQVPDQQQPQPQEDGQNQAEPAPLNSDGKGISQVPPEGMNIPDPSPEDLKKYDLELQNYESEQDVEDIDYSSIE